MVWKKKAASSLANLNDQKMIKADLPFDIAVFGKVLVKGLDASSGLKISKHFYKEL